MSRAGRCALSMLLWTWGGTVYFFMEVIYKSMKGRPESISWTMLMLAIVLCIPLERAGSELPWECSLWLQALIAMLLITLTELASGLVLNVLLGLSIWDYSNVPFNLYGQICLPFCVLWYFVCLFAIPIFDWLRWVVCGTEKPRYYLISNFVKSRQSR